RRRRAGEDVDVIEAEVAVELAGDPAGGAIADQRPPPLELGLAALAEAAEADGEVAGAGEVGHLREVVADVAGDRLEFAVAGDRRAPGRPAVEGGEAAGERPHAPRRQIAAAEPGAEGVIVGEAA